MFLAWLFTLVCNLTESHSYEAFLQKHCVRCHNAEQTEGELNIEKLSRDFQSGSDTHHWVEIVERINAGEMPPKDEAKPTQDELATFITDLDSLIKEGKANRMAARPPVTHYRLSRKEYQNTVYDLLGVRYDPSKPGELNADPLWHGFERIGSELSLSPSHVDRYYRAAELVLNRAYPPVPREARKVRKTAADLRYSGGKSQQALLDRFGIKRPLRYLLFPGRVESALSPQWFGKTGPEHSGLYRVRIQASGITPVGGQPAHLSIGKATGEETNEGLIEFDITAHEDHPEVYEFEVLLEMPTTLHFNVVSTDTIDRRKGAHYRNALSSGLYLFTHSSETVLLNPTAPQMFDDHGNGLFPTVLIDWVEWEGPLESESERVLRTDFWPPQEATQEVVADHLRRFAERAWRRPVKLEELDRFLQMHQSEIAAGESASEAYRVAMQAVLTSRNFLYLVEGDVVPREQLTEWEFASRLSYFLWSSMPDAPLFDAARNEKLKGDELIKEVDRLMASPKIENFIEDFARQWLQLHRLGMFPPDKKLYPQYDAWLETSMRGEVIEYFREMFKQNQPIDGFIESDWTMANPRLCAFYGLPAPKTGGFQRVSLKPEDQRGGLLAMGAVLGLTSDGTRHRPVHRGVWISESIFGKTPPPPPANVSAIEPNPPESPKATIRQKLEAHRQDANCAACHRNIDPLGLAWDQYDAIGQWRTREKVERGLGDDPLINPAGEMPDGRPFSDARQFKQRLLENRSQFVRAFIEHLSTYALRRVLTIDDRDEIRAIESEVMKHNCGVKDIVRAVALSDLIRKR